MPGYLIMTVPECELALFCSGLSDELTGHTCIETLHGRKRKPWWTVI
jgi:hypothetical protein